MKKLRESDSLRFKTLSPEEKSKRGILGRLYGKVASCVNPTRNSRHYSEELWENLFNSDLIKERFKNGGIFGELCHPDYEEVDMEKIAIVMPEPPVKDKDGDLVAYVDIVDTPCGRIAYQLAKYGYKFGISSRGTGDLIGEDVDPETYQLNAFDLVEVPAVEQARLSFVESLDSTKKYGKTLKQRLGEELKNASKDERKIMLESMSKMNINLVEEANSYLRGTYWVVDDSEPFEYKTARKYLLADEDVTPEEFDDDPTWWFDKFGWKEVDPPAEEMSKADYEAERADIYVDERRLGESKVYPKEYHGYGIDFNIYGNNEYSVQVDGDDTIFNSEQEAMEFIDSLKPIQAEALDMSKDTDFEEYDELVHGIYKAIIKTLKEYIPSNITEPLSNVSEGDLERAANEAIIRVLESDEILLDSISESCRYKEELELDDEADDSGSFILSELQEALIRCKDLTNDNLSLQEKLSVCNAKEVQLEESISKHKTALIRLSDKARTASTLNEKLEAAYDSIAKKDNIIKSARSKFEALKSSSSSKISELSDENSTLNEQVNHLKDQNDSINKKLSESLEKVKQYQKAYKNLKESYISTKAVAYGIDEDSIKKNLNESYSVKDIDSICEELANQKRALNKLPFKLTESSSVYVKGSSNEYIYPKTQRTNLQNDDDYVSDSLLQILN